MLVVPTLLWSRLFYAAGAWVQLTEVQKRKLSGIHLAVAHAAAQSTIEERIADPSATAVLQKTGLSSATALVHAARLRLMSRLLISAPGQVLALVDATDAWATLVVESCVWMAQLVEACRQLPDPTVQLQDWLVAAKHGRRWRSWIRTALANDCERLRTAGAACSTLPGGGGGDVADGKHFCYTCARQFQSANALQAHFARAHGLMGQQRGLVYGTSCIACLKEFHCISRCFKHLRSGAYGCAARITRAQSDGLLARGDCTEVARHARGLPSLQLPGPLPRWACTAIDGPPA